MKQMTLQGEFTLEGKGLHTGAQLSATFCPAPDNHGYKIQRTDLDGQPVIDAVAENVVATHRGTVIGKGDATVSTIEHAMAALYASGIDNCLIKVNGPEIPILDGSAKPFFDAIQAVGVTEQIADKDCYYVKHKVEVIDAETGSKLMLLPDDEFSLDVKVNFESKVLANQYATLDHICDFDADIAWARTFVFVREIEPLLKAGLIKGGDLDNAIVIYENPKTQEELDHLADIMGAPHHDANDFGFLNTIPLPAACPSDKIKMLDVAPIFARAIAHIHGGTSIADLF